MPTPGPIPSSSPPAELETCQAAPRQPTPRQQSPPEEPGSDEAPRPATSSTVHGQAGPALEGARRVFAREWPLAVSVGIPCTGVWILLGVLPSASGFMDLFVALCLVMLGAPGLYELLRPYSEYAGE